MTHIELLLLMGAVSRNMFSNPQPANAPFIPFTPFQIGGWQYQPNGNWQRSNWDGSQWVPIPGDYATGSDRFTLDGARTDLLGRSTAQQEDFERSINREIPLILPPNLPIPSSCNRDYTAARGWSAPRDPLVLDLDGDGIETVGINPAASVLFDHDGDTLRTGTGWVGTDDGLLVLDINSNGVIDTGRELFGDNTRLGSAANAPNAQNSHQALRQYGSNGDNQVNSADAVYKYHLLLARNNLCKQTAKSMHHKSICSARFSRQTMRALGELK